MRFEREISRVVSFSTGQHPRTRGSLQKISRSGIVIEIYDPFVLVRTSEVLTDLKLHVGREVLYHGDAVVTGVVSSSVVLVVSATLVGNWANLKSVVTDARYIGEEARRFLHEWDRSNQLDASYRLRVDELRSFLGDLRYWLDKVELAYAVDHDGVASLQPEHFEDLNASIAPRLMQLSMNLEEACARLQHDDVGNHKLSAQRDLTPLLLPSPFFNRIFSKPLGYAGDYQMVDMMYRNQCAGKTTYAQVVDSWMLAGPPAQAHRNRIDILTKFISDMLDRTVDTTKPFRILNVGCGPVHELQQLLSVRSDVQRLQIDLLDFNRETLDYAKERVTEILGPRSNSVQVAYKLQSVQDLLRQAIERSDVDKKYDFIYCAGLFDYLSDRVCSKLINLFAHWCEPGGRILVTNVHASNPVKGLMEHVMEWHLVLRNEQEMMRLAPDPSRAKVYTDFTGINVFMEVSGSS